MKYDHDSVFQRAIRGFETVQSSQQEERELSLSDRRFYSIPGAQWEGDLSKQYENKPKVEVNKTHKSVIEIVNEYRNNPVTVEFVSADGERNDQLSDALNGIFRADMEDSCADEAFDNGFEEGAGGGFGAWRLTNQLEDEYDDENEHQRIRFEPIFEADKHVYFDLGAKKQDKSDAKQCWVLSTLPREDFKEQYEQDPTDWPTIIDKSEFDWCTPDTVTIAEYYETEINKEKRFVYKLGDKEEVYSPEDFEEDETLEQGLIDSGWKLDREKTVKVKKIHKYLMSGGGILEDLDYIAGREIPIIPFYGKRWYVDDIERFMGHVRLAKDPQRIKNTYTSKLMEISSLSSVEKPYFAAEQVAGFENEHATDNIENYPYLRINPLTDAMGNIVAAGPIGYTRVPQIPPALTGLLNITDIDIKEIIGTSSQNEEIVSNISGKAVNAILNKVDMKTFIYISNFAKAMKRTGDVWLSMAKDIYVEDKRKLKTLGTQNEIGTIELNRPVFGEDGSIYYENNIKSARMGVRSTVGPTSDTKRQKTVENVTAMMTMVSDPETQLVLSHMALNNMDGEGIQDIRKWSRKKLLSLGVVQPTEEELKELQAQAQANQQPDANEQYLLAAAQKEAMDAQKKQAETALTIAKVQETQAKTEETRADIIKTLSEVDAQDRAQLTSINNPSAQTNSGL